MQHMQWDTPTRLEGSRASRELRRTYLNEMTVLGLRGLGSVFFQRSTDAGYIDFCRQSFEFSRGQHATNEPVEHERRGLSAVFLTTPSSAARRIKTSQKLTVGMLSTASEGWGQPGSAVPGALGTHTHTTKVRLGTRRRSAEDGQRRVLVRCYAMLCVGSTSGSGFRYYSA